MKRILFGFIATTVLAISVSAFAATGTYYSSLKPKATKTLAVPATNITVTNYSEEGIYVIVPNSPIHDFVGSGKSDTVSNDSYYGNTHLVLQDINGGIFFDNSVCRRAIVTVDGRPGSYHINVDNKFCY